MKTLRLSPAGPQAGWAGAIEDAARTLRGGGVVLYPTDTLYGVAVDPRSDAAVLRLFEAKGRERTAAIPLVAASLDQAESTGLFDERALNLARTFWPGPLTVVVPARAGLAAQLLAGGSTIAIRVPAHPVARALAGAFGACITATSANRSGRPPAAAAAEIDAGLRAYVDLLLDAGPAPGGPPSTIVEVGSGNVRLVRAGAIAWNRVLESLK